MKKILLILFLFCINLHNLFAQLQVTEHRLSNGMKVWLNEDHTSANIFGAVVVHAGAIDSPGTGIAHYLEHMAFKGTDKIGTIDYSKEKPLLDSIESLYNKLYAEKLTDSRAALQKDINRLSIESAKYAIPNEFDKLLQTYGGTNVNAYTSYDHTVYHNSFSPQFIRQWCELNSERLLHPVFRLFQSELETVYEEKNMYDDALGFKALEKALEIYFAPSPYAYQIIGTTESLKNPNMSQMRNYYKQFYNASNMDLLIIGDFNSNEILPLLEQTFGRIPCGELVSRNYAKPRAIKGRQNIDLKVNIPIIRGRLYGWRGITDTNPDKLKLDIALQLLTNNNGTGYLDSLSTTDKCLVSAVISQNFIYEGMLGAILVPNILGGSMDKAEKLLFNQIDRVKRGDINPTILESIKLTLKRDLDSQLEIPQERARIMIKLLSAGQSWNDFLNDVIKIDDISINEISEVARKYFNEDYLCITKKTGNYDKEKLSKPPFKPIPPHNQGSNSAYAKELAKLPLNNSAPKFLDFNTDVQIMNISPLVKVYVVENTMNDLFSLTFIFREGYMQNPKLKYLSTYMAYTGSDSLDNVQLKTELQKLGASLETDCSSDKFSITLTGYDTNIEPTLQLFTSYLKNLGFNDKAIKKVVDSKILSNRTFSKNTEEISHALREYVSIGLESSYLNDLTTAEIRRIKSSDFVRIFDTLRSVECDIAYCGKLSVTELTEKLKSVYDFSIVRTPSCAQPRNLKSYEKPLIYIVNAPNAKQSIIYTYTKSASINTDSDRLYADLIGTYLGGGMSSLLFQELREFRSLSYRTGGAFNTPHPIHYGSSGALFSMLSTQTDKTQEAVEVLDSLLRTIKFDSTRLESAKQKIINDIYSQYPNTRNKAVSIANLLYEGNSFDPAQFTYNNIASIGTSEIATYHKRQIEDKPIVYMIVGNYKMLNINSLEKFGRVVKLTKKDIQK